MNIVSVFFLCIIFIVFQMIFRSAKELQAFYALVPLSHALRWGCVGAGVTLSPPACTGVTAVTLPEAGSSS